MSNASQALRNQVRGNGGNVGGIVREYPQQGAYARRDAGQAANDKPKSQLWVDVGYISENPDDGSPMFIGLYHGIGLDTMEQPTGNSDLMSAKRGFWEELMELGHPLAPGETMLLSDNGLIAVQLRRLPERREDTAKTNPHLARLQALKLSFAQRNATGDGEGSDD